MERNREELVQLSLPGIDSTPEVLSRPRHQWLFPSLVVTSIGYGLLIGARPNWTTDVENLIDSLGLH